MQASFRRQSRRWSALMVVLTLGIGGAGMATTQSAGAAPVLKAAAKTKPGPKGFAGLRFRSCDRIKPTCYIGVVKGVNGKLGVEWNDNADKVATGYKSGYKKVYGEQMNRIAWIAAKYGTRRNEVQGLIVHLAIDKLKSNINIASQVDRIRYLSTEYRQLLIDETRSLVKRSKDQAGPYRIEVTGPDQMAIDGQAAFEFRLLSARGKPVPDELVEFSKAGGTEMVGSFRTNAKGKGAATVGAANFGDRDLIAYAPKLPFHYVHLARPHTSGASKLVIAGKKGPVYGKKPLRVMARPKLTLSSLPPYPGGVAVQIKVSGMNQKSGTKLKLKVAMRHVKSGLNACSGIRQSKYWRTKSIARNGIHKHTHNITFTGKKGRKVAFFVKTAGNGYNLSAKSNCTVRYVPPLN